MKIKGNYIGLYFAPFLVDMYMGSIIIAVSLLAISLGASSLILGILGFTPGLAFISLCFLFGKLSERWHRKNLVMLGSSVYIVASLLLSFSSRIYQLYLCMLLVGIAGAMFWPAMEAWIAEKQSKRTLVQRMALFNTSWSGGFAIGPLLGGILFEINFKLPFYLALFSSTFIFFILPRESSKVNPFTKSKTSIYKTPFPKDPPENFSLYIIISRIANFTLGFSVGMILYIFPKLGTQLAISPSFLGFLMSSLAFSQTFTFYGLGIIHQWRYCIFPLIFFQLLAIIGLVVIFFTNTLPLFFLAFVFIGMGIGMTYSSSLFYSVNIPWQRGPSTAIHETILASGFFLGPLVGGIIAQKLSLRAPYLATVAIVAVGILIQILIKRYYGFPNKVATSQKGSLHL